MEIIAENPFHKIKVRFKEKVTLPRIIPREEIEHILNHIYKCLNKSTEKSRRYILRDVAVVELFFATGARVYEISNIKEDCVDLHTGLIRIMGKGGKERYVQISNTSVLHIVRTAPQVIYNLVEMFIKIPCGFGAMQLAWNLSKKLNMKVFGWIGTIAYELYLLHGYILSHVEVSWTGWMIFIVASFGGAGLMYKTKKIYEPYLKKRI